MARHEMTLRIFRVIHYLETSRLGLRVSDIHQRLEHDGFNVDVRTVHRDLDLLVQAHIPVQTEGSGAESRWVLAPFAEAKQSIKFTYEEVFALFVARNSLDHLKGTPLHSALDSLFVKLEKVLGKNGDAFKDLMTHLAFRPQMTWHTSVPVVTLDTVYGALEEGYPLKITYRAEGGEHAGQPVDRTVGPECLYFANGSVYLIAIDLKKDEPRTYALSRMTTAEMLTDQNYKKRGLSPEEMFRESFGILNAGEVDAVEILVTGPVAAFAAERRWHESQETVRTSDGTLLRFHIRINEELARFVLGLGPAARVVKPKSLQSLVSQMALDIAAGYKAKPPRSA